MKQITIVTVILILLSLTASAQHSESEFGKAYERALLDSSYRYELLKPTFFSLKSAYESQSEEIASLRDALRLQNLQVEVQKQSIAAAIVEEREKTRGKWWRGLRIGLGAGLAGGLLIGLKL